MSNNKAKSTKKASVFTNSGRFLWRDFFNFWSKLRKTPKKEQVLLRPIWRRLQGYFVRLFQGDGASLSNDKKKARQRKLFGARSFNTPAPVNM